MQHVGSVEAVVAELVEDEFVGGEVGNGARRKSSGSSGDVSGQPADRWRGGGKPANRRSQQLIDSEEEGGFRELALVVAVFAVADGADRHDDMDVRIEAAQEVYRLTEVVGTLVDGELLFLKEGGRALLAVVDNLAGSLEAVDMVGAEGEESDTRTRRRNGGSSGDVSG